MDFEKRKVFLVNITFITVTLFMIFFIVRFMLIYLLPFVIGVILAFLMQKPANMISAKSRFSKSTIASVLVCATYILIVGLIGTVIWLIFNYAVKIVDTLPQYFRDFQVAMSGIYNRMDKIFESMPDTAKNTIEGVISGTANSFSRTLADFFSSFAGKLAKSLPALLFSSIVTIIASFYIAKDYDRIVRFVSNMISEKRLSIILKIKNIVTDSVLKISVGYLILMGITFVELMVGFMILDVKYAPALAAVTAVIDLLPVLGTGTVLLPWSIICFIGASPLRGIGFILLYLLITVLRNVFEPKIIGKQTGINPLLSLITIFVGFKLSGIAGMILLPIIVIVIINYYKQQLLEEKL